MKAFFTSVAAAIILAVVSVYALNTFQEPADIAFKAPASVRL
jgi:hypothetical protein